MEINRGLNQKATVEELSGYGDESYVIHNQIEGQSIIHVLLKRKAYIEIKAEHLRVQKK